MARGKRGAAKNKCTKVCVNLSKCTRTACTFAHKHTDMNSLVYKTLECTNKQKCKGKNCIYYHTPEEKEVASYLRGADPDGEEKIMFFMFFGALEAQGQVQLPEESRFGHVVALHATRRSAPKAEVPTAEYESQSYVGWESYVG